MIISEFDLCKREWLELVFADRNKKYGAYELRNSYSDIMLRAIVITVFSVSALAVTANIISHHHNNTGDTVVEMPLTTIAPPVKPAEQTKPVVPVKQQAALKETTPVKTQEFKPFVVQPDDKVIDPPKELQQNVAVGQQDNDKPGSNGDNVDTNIGAGDGPGGPGGPGLTESNDPVNVVDLQVMPEPIGGQGAWAKFLQKNLRFPGMAQEQGVSGKVFMTFIIEKDGHLSDIKILRGAGYGFDEEALRVLKLAPAWKPGIQNGHSVRVQYTIPINFQISND